MLPEQALVAVTVDKAATPLSVQVQNSSLGMAAAAVQAAQLQPLLLVAAAVANLVLAAMRPLVLVELPVPMAA